MKSPFISICIPSYHSARRPGNLYRLLKTIDVTDHREIEVIICDDKSPEIEKVRDAVHRFKKESPLAVSFFENKENLGYDRNVKETVRHAHGMWIVFMGDDDEFVPGALQKVIVFLKQHPELGYMLKSHITVHPSGREEKFRYYAGTRFFPAGPETLAELFRRSVFIAGFTIRRALIPPLIDDFDHSLLVQNYFLGEVVLKHPSAYFDEPFTKQYADGAALAGGSSGEVHAVRDPSFETSVNFLKSFISVPYYFDKKYGLSITREVQRDMSKYFYPTLAVHANKGPRVFMRYVREMQKLGFACTPYFYLYAFGLLVFGRKFCDALIVALKRILGRTPQL